MKQALQSLDGRRGNFVIARRVLEWQEVAFLFDQEDRQYMERALALAQRGAGHTRPNPMVGAVLVKEGRIIGEGWHGHFGGPHAEVEAFRSCTEDPVGATLYVTLEPCAHYGKTPPCADLVVRKKVGRVVAAMVDPNPLVAGKGIEKIRRSGIPVEVGLMEPEARRLNEVFLKYVTEKKPFVLYKAAMSLDGKTACRTGDSQWISSETSRKAARRLRGLYAGIMTGIGTILADDPRLTARTEGLNDPARIIADSHLRIPLAAKVLHEPGRVILLTTSAAEAEKKEALLAMGAEVITAGGPDGEVDLPQAMTELARRGIDGILLEGGATLAGAALSAGILDKVLFYAAPLLIGGAGAPSPFGGTGAASLQAAWPLTELTVSKSDADLAITAYIDKEGPCSQASLKK